MYIPCRSNVFRNSELAAKNQPSIEFLFMILNINYLLKRNYKDLKIVNSMYFIIQGMPQTAMNATNALF